MTNNMNNMNNLTDIKRLFLSNFSCMDSEKPEKSLKYLNSFNPFSHNFNSKLIHDEVFCDFNLEKYLEDSLNNIEYTKKSLTEYVTLIDIDIEPSFCICTYLDFNKLEIVQTQYKKSLYYKFMFKYNDFKEKQNVEFEDIKKDDNKYMSELDFFGDE